MPAPISCGFCAVPALSCEVLISGHGEASAPLFLQPLLSSEWNQRLAAVAPRC
jgi:hypothetical protein